MERLVGYADIDGMKLKEVNHASPPRVRIERKEYNGAHTSLLSSIASDDTCELVALAEEILCGSSLQPESSNPCPQIPNSNLPAADVNKGASTSINDMYSIVKKKSKAENENKKKPVPPPRLRMTQQDRLKTNGNESANNGNTLPSSPHRTISSSSNAKSRKSVGKANNGSSEKQFSSPQKHLVSSNHKLRRPRADNEVHDYAEIYTPSGEQAPDIYPESRHDNRPPTPPLHRCPSWVSTTDKISLTYLIIRKISSIPYLIIYSKRKRIISTFCNYKLFIITILSRNKS